MSTASSDPRVKNLRPFGPGYDPRRGRVGNVDGKTRKLRKRLAKLDDKAMKLLESLMDSGESDLMIEALKFSGKYRLPVPTEKTAAPLGVAPSAVTMSPELAAKIAAMEVQ